MNDRTQLGRRTQGANAAERGRAPLVAALAAYERRRTASFHVPGHKAGAAYREDPSVSERLGSIGAWDATELRGLDDLHAPEGAIAEAQALAAACFGADRTYFLVGGSTVGNLAAIGAAASAGELVVMQRNVHKSALHALALFGLGAVFVAPERDAATGLYGGVEASAVEEALRRYPEARAVFVTSPNYYGMTADVAALADVAHARGVPLIVDEAHGAHFGHHPRFPRSALQCGADVVVQSTHKMLPALTMGAMLHVQGHRASAERIERWLRMLQSSSPSYPIMASLDWARRELHANGAAMFEPALRAVDRMTEALATSGEESGRAGERFGVRRTADPLKPLLYDRYGELSGYALSDKLADAGVYVEMADETYAVLACSAATSEADTDAAVRALREIDVRDPAKKKEIRLNFSNTKTLWGASLSSPVYMRADEPLQPGSGDCEAVPLERSAGAVSAEMVIPYPPGIPLLYPGERISAQVVDALAALREQGAAVQGVRDRTLRTIAVRKEAEPF